MRTAEHRPLPPSGLCRSGVRLRGAVRALLAAALLVAAVLGSLLAGCSAATVTTTTHVSAGDAGTTGATTAPSSPTDAGRPVTFTTQDGISLAGHLFGSGHEGVVLAHMYPADQTSWLPTARRLANEGYLVLTFDFRGYGESGGQKQIDLIDRDVSAAIGKIRQEGAAAVVLAGASMGGTASLVAGDRAQALDSIRLAGIATLSAPVEFRGLSAAEAVPRLVVPLLFMAAENDVGAAGARQLEDLSSGRGDLHIVSGSDHGTDLLTGLQGDAVYSLLSQFLQKCLRG
jgi:pimeloyl-ACP methyl ester carboxylesterase